MLAISSSTAGTLHRFNRYEERCRLKDGRGVALRFSLHLFEQYECFALGSRRAAEPIGAVGGLEANYRPSRGDGLVPGTLALRVPDTYKGGTFAPPPSPPPTVPTSSVSEAL